MPNPPFSLKFTTVDLKSDIPFRFTTLSPDFSIYKTLNRGEFTDFLGNQDLYQQNDYVLIYVLDGTFYQRIEQNRYKYLRDSCCFMNPNVKHSAEYSTDFSIVSLSLSEKYWKEIIASEKDILFSAEKGSMMTDYSKFVIRENSIPAGNQGINYMNFVSNKQNTKPYFQNIRFLLEQVTYLILNPTPGTSLLIKGCLFRILHLLDDPELYHATSIQFGSDKERLLFNQITNLMQDFYGRITRNQLAEQLNYSGNYLNKIVKKYTGMNICHYRNTFTMKQAAWLLTNTKMSITEIISELGCSDRTYFYKKFADEYGITPMEYRKKYYQPHLVD